MSSAEGQQIMNKPPSGKTIGILALQGNFAQHAAVLRKLGLGIVFVRRAEDITNGPPQLDGLILPGGESTTMCRLLDNKMREAICAFARDGKPILGTCAGLILLATRMAQEEGNGNDGHQMVCPLGLLNVEVQRNAYGPHIHSEFKQIRLKAENGTGMSVSFIRAPALRSVGPQVEVLATLPDGQTPCAVRQQNIIAMTFHPEMSGIEYFHKLAFLP